MTTIFPELRPEFKRAMRLIHQNAAQPLRLTLEQEPEHLRTLELTEAIDRLMDRYSARQVLNAVLTASKARGIE